MKLGEVPYENDFYWQGQRYTQFMKPKIIIKPCDVMCYLAKSPDGRYFDMPSEIIVKPVIKHE